MIAIVAENTGTNNSLALFQAAFQGVSLWSNFSICPSKTTMALSTTIPNTTIKPANETVCSSTPNAYKIPIVMKMEIGMVAPATAATRKGSKSIVTIITAKMAMANSFKKCVMECPTACGISAIFATCTSGEILPFSVCNVSSTVSPKETMLLPGCISKEISRLFVPLFLM